MRQKMIAAFLGLVLTFTLSGAAQASSADMSDLVIYQIITDRFYDGDPTNNNPTTSAGQYSANKSNWRFYWGGDWKGIAQKIPYLADMGVGAIWISPPVQNLNIPVWNDAYGAYEGSYHGYWAMDYFRPEPHYGTWADFDHMVDTAHSYGIKVIVDWAPNHSNYSGKALDGALYRDGALVTTYSTDSDPTYYHHNGDITKWDDRYETQYKSMVALSDFAGESAPANQYLRDAIDTWLAHGIDGLRIDAVKLMPLGWQKSYYDHIYSNESIFMFGEWFDVSSAPLWSDAVKLANTSGISILNFDLNDAIRGVFMHNQSMHNINNAINRNAMQFTYPNQLPIFVNNHDIPRFLSVNPNTTLFDQAIVASMTVPGIPVVYYGDEQYLHNDTDGGKDPYNRPMMTTWGQTTRAYQLIQKLSALRKENPALQYGLNRERWINNDVYIYERQFYDNVVLIAVNKGTTSYHVSGLYTALPAGAYVDHLDGLLGGTSISVSPGTGGNNPVSAFTLGPNQTAVWHYVAPTPTTPQIGNVGPVMGRSGNVVTITGKGFGSVAGTVKFGSANATIVDWTPDRITVKVPSNATPGYQQITVNTGGGSSNDFLFNVLSGEQVPTTFKVKNALPTAWGDNIYLTGNIPELGNWSTDPNQAVGPLITHDGMYPDWFGVVSLPTNTSVEFKFIRIDTNGNVTWESGANHTYVTPSTGDTPGYVEVFWQY